MSILCCNNFYFIILLYFVSTFLYFYDLSQTDIRKRNARAIPLRNNSGTSPVYTTVILTKLYNFLNLAVDLTPLLKRFAL